MLQPTKAPKSLKCHHKGARACPASTCLGGGCTNPSLVANKRAKPGKGSQGRNEDANQEGRRKEKKPFGLWKQAVDSLKLGINSIYTNAVQAIKPGHSLSCSEESLE